MLFQVVGEGFAYGLVDGAADFAVAQLGLGLSLELGFGHFDGDDGDEAFAEVFARYFHFGFFELLGAGVFGVLLEDAGQCGAESGFVRSAFLGVDVVDVGMEVLAVAGVIHDGALDGHAGFFGVQVDDVVEQGYVVAVQVADELFHAFFRVEYFADGVAVFVFLAEVGQRDADTCVEVGQFAQTCLQGRVFIGGDGEDASVGPEGLFGSGESGVACAYFLDGVEGFPAFVFLLIDFSVAEYLGGHVRGEGVDAGYADAVQTA